MMLLQPENDQAGAIFYEDGYENLLLSVSLDWTLQGNRSVWIFPVPAQPQDVRIDVLKGFPTYDGTRIQDKYAMTVGTVAFASASYATFPLTTPFVLAGLAGGSAHGGFAGAPPAASGDIVVYERVEKRGLKTEVVSAKDADALANYLASQGLAVPSKSLGMLDDYIVKDYSFVVTSVQNVTEYREQFPAKARGISGHFYRDSGSDDILGVFVRFPTDRIYFPLKPTRAYGNRTIPLLLTTNGFVTPVLPPGISPQASVEYLLQDTYTPPAALGNFFNDRREIAPYSYTRIMIAVPAENYTDDLWLDQSTPPGIPARLWMIRYYPVIGAGLYILLSAVAALLAGLLVFQRGSVTPGQLLRHGLWNCVTLIGLVYATRRFLVLPGDENKKRARFVAVFVLLFLVLMTAVALALEPSFITLVPVSPFIILMGILPGLWESAAIVFAGIAGHAAYLPDDRLIIWGMAISGLVLLVAFLLYAERIIQRYLNEP